MVVAIGQFARLAPLFGDEFFLQEEGNLQQATVGTEPTAEGAATPEKGGDSNHDPRHKNKGFGKKEPKPTAGAYHVDKGEEINHRRLSLVSQPQEQNRAEEHR